MKLIVGLGNPGRQYAKTRHNIGFEVLDELAVKFGRGTPRAKFSGEVLEADVSGVKSLLLWPHTFMNNSGNCVQPVRDFYKIENPDLLVVCDDFSLALAKLRFRPKGSSGGQKGLQDIIRRLGTEEVPRLRIGIGLPPEGRDPADFVLSRFTSEEKSVVQEALIRAANAVVDWVHKGTDYCMNTYNAN